MSTYGATKHEAAELVLARGGGVLVCGLVVERDPPRGPYRMLKKNVARLPLAFRALSVASSWMRKDLGIAIDEARKNGAHLPVSALVDQFYSEVIKLGGARWDTCSLLARLNNQSAEKKA